MWLINMVYFASLLREIDPNLSDENAGELKALLQLLMGLPDPKTLLSMRALNFEEVVSITKIIWGDNGGAKGMSRETRERYRKPLAYLLSRLMPQGGVVSDNAPPKKLERKGGWVECTLRAPIQVAHCSSITPQEIGRCGGLLPKFSSEVCIPDGRYFGAWKYCEFLFTFRLPARADGAVTEPTGAKKLGFGAFIYVIDLPAGFSYMSQGGLLNENLEIVLFNPVPLQYLTPYFNRGKEPAEPADHTATVDQAEAKHNAAKREMILRAQSKSAGVKKVGAAAAAAAASANAGVVVAPVVWGSSAAHVMPVASAHASGHAAAAAAANAMVTASAHAAAIGPSNRPPSGSSAGGSAGGPAITIVVNLAPPPPAFGAFAQPPVRLAGVQMPAALHGPPARDLYYAFRPNPMELNRAAYEAQVRQYAALHAALDAGHPVAYAGAPTIELLKPIQIVPQYAVVPPMAFIHGQAAAAAAAAAATATAAATAAASTVKRP